MRGELDVSERVPHGARVTLWLAVSLSGAAGLTWEVLFQHFAGLSLGISAFGTAVTLAALMAGLGLGALIAGRLAQAGRIERPLRAYGIAEITVGIAGLWVPPGLRALAQLDTMLYAHSPPLADALRVVGIGLLLLVPGAALGATLPLLAPRTLRVRTTLPTLYALNTAGAVLGVVLVTFVALPLWGVHTTVWLTAAINVLVGGWAIAQATQQAAQADEAPGPWPPARSLALAFSSAWVVFALEVSWFRSLRAAYQATTETFSALLAAVLVALALGGWLAPRIRARYPDALARIAALAACAVLCVTPLIDRIDQISPSDAAAASTPLLRFSTVLYLVIAPVTLTGMLFPWLLSEHASTRQSGRLFAINTLGAALGALLAGFVLLPWVGASATSWCAGFVLTAVALLSARSLQRRVAALLVAALGAALAVSQRSGGAHERVQGFQSQDFHDVAFVSEGPDSTVWVARERHSQRRVLIIDGFQASGEGPGTGYMHWMGHLPALATPHLRRALVICFGTGQTADAVRSHQPETLSIVDINPAVFAAASLFQSNHDVLHDPHVQRWTMDGRAFLRRHPQARFDAITLEPMPPNHAGVNNLYSLEFYQQLRAHLAPAGSVAQWLPLHLIAPEHMRAIVGAFVGVFPEARLWLDPEGTGILVGASTPWSLAASKIALPLTATAVRDRFLLEAGALRALSAGHAVVTDDNQLLSYGFDRLARSGGRGQVWWRELAQENLRILRSYAPLSHASE
jgi:spermidine synthase